MGKTKIQEIYLKKSFPLIGELKKLIEKGRETSGFYEGYNILRSGLKDIVKLLESNGFSIKVKEKR